MNQNANLPNPKRVSGDDDELSTGSNGQVFDGDNIDDDDDAHATVVK